MGQGDRYCRICGLPVGSGAPVEGHRYVTVLFSDLSGYTRLSGLLDPEELKTLMEEIFKEAVRVISSYGGVVEKFLGDAVVAIFGMHRIHEDDVIRAIRCAAEIHEFVDRLDGRAVCADTPEKLSMHTGIHAGTVLVEDAHEVPLYQGIIGMPIIIAQRLSDLAAPGEILISGSLRHEAGRFFLIEPLGIRDLKGLKDPVSVYRIGPWRGIPLGIRRPEGVRAPMVGREEQLSALMRAFEELLHGKGAAMLITGEAGVGKSRLVYEFGKHVAGESLFVTAQCLDHMRDIPYYPIISLLEQLAGSLIPGGEGPGRALEDLLPNPRHAFHIRSLLCRKHGGEDLVPDVWKTEICESVSGLLKVYAQAHPLVICIEDLHWADETTRDLLSCLLQEEGAGYLCLVTSREPIPLLAGQGVLALQEISLKYTEELLRGLTGVKDISEEAVAALYRATGGNPLFLEEYVSYLEEQGVSPLQAPAGDGSYRVPETIQGILSARMENLGRERKQLLQEASALGMVFPRDMLEAVTSVKGDLGSLLDDLEKAGFVTRTHGRQYRFRHALTREVAYATLLKRHRIVLHKRIGSYLEQTSNTRTEHCGMIAYHLHRAREYSRAVPYFILAARTYQAEGSWMEAAAQYKGAEDSLLRDDSLPGRDEMLVQIREGMWTCSRVFNPDQAIHALEDLVRHYAQYGPKSQEIFSKIRLINLYSQKARFTKALELYNEVSSESEGGTLLAAAAKTAVAYTYTFLGKPGKALEYLDEARGILGGSDRFLAAVNSLTTLAAWVWRGDIHQAHTWYSRTKQQVSPYMDLDLIADVWHAYMLFLKGEFSPGNALMKTIREKEKKLGDLAGGVSYLRIQSSIYLFSRYTGWIDAAQRELDTLETLKHDHTRIPGLIELYRAWIALGMEDYREAEKQAQKCLPLLEAGVANRVPYALNTLAEAFLMLGDLSSAREIAARAVNWNELNGNAEQLVLSWRITAAVCIKTKEHESARALLHKASILARDMAMKPHVAWATASWGDLFAAAGQREKAGSCYRRSIALWNEMGISCHATRSIRALQGCSPSK